jgi:hypothetical protein
MLLRTTYMYLLYIFFLYQTGASTSLRAYELTGLRSVKGHGKDQERYICTTHHVQSFFSSLISISHQPSLTMTSATKVASWLSKEHHQTRKAMRRPLEPLFACSLGRRRSSLDLDNSLGAFSRTTLPNRRWSTFTTRLYRPTTLSKFDIYFEEKTGSVWNRTSASWLRPKVVLASWLQDLRRRRHADRCQHVRVVQYRYNLKDSQEVMKYVRMCMLQWAWKSNTTNTTQGWSCRSSRCCPSRPSKCDTCGRTPRQGVMAARRYTTAAGVSEADWSNTRQHADIFGRQL